MKPSQYVSPMATALCLGLSASAVPMMASAGVSGTISVANLYLFRGVNLSNSAPQVSGSLDFEHDSGLYAGVWASSEGVAGEQEYNIYAGFGGEIEGFGYDIQLIDYAYPSNSGAAGNSAEDFGDYSEVILGFTAGPASLQIVDSLQSENSSDPDSAGGYQYYALAYTSDIIGINLGVMDLPKPVDDSMTHLDLSVFISDEFTFTASQIIDNPKVAGAEQYADDLLFVATWSKSFDL